MPYKNIRVKHDGTYLISFNGYENFHISPSYPTTYIYGSDYTFEALDQYAKAHPKEVTSYEDVSPIPTHIPTEEDKRKFREDQYRLLTDPLILERERKKLLNEWSEELEAEFLVQLVNLTKRIKSL